MKKQSKPSSLPVCASSLTKPHSVRGRSRDSRREKNVGVSKSRHIARGRRKAQGATLTVQYLYHCRCRPNFLSILECSVSIHIKTWMPEHCVIRTTVCVLHTAHYFKGEVGSYSQESITPVPGLRI